LKQIFLPSCWGELALKSCILSREVNWSAGTWEVTLNTGVIATPLGLKLVAQSEICFKSRVGIGSPRTNYSCSGDKHVTKIFAFASQG